MEPPNIVSICGPSAAGKSQLAKAVAALLGPERCARLPTDHLLELRDIHDPETGERRGALTYDWTLLDEILRLPIGTEVSTPDVDFERLTRRAPTGGPIVVVRPIMLTDAFVPYPSATLRVRLTAPEPVRRARMIERDARWRSRVVDRWSLLEATWAGVATQVSSWDLTLSGKTPIERNAKLLARALAPLAG